MARWVGKASGSHGGRAGAWGSRHAGSHTGSQGQSSGSSSLTSWRSGLGASEWSSQPQPLLGLSTHHGRSGPLIGTDMGTCHPALGEGAGISGPSHPLYQKGSLEWEAWQEPHHCRDLDGEEGRGQ